MRFLLRGVSVHASVVAARYKQRGSEYLGASFGSKAERHGRIDRSLIVNMNLGPIAKYEPDSLRGGPKVTKSWARKIFWRRLELSNRNLAGRSP